MILEKQRVLFFSRTVGMGGTSNVMLQMCEVLQPRVEKMVICSRGGPMADAFEELGVKHYRIPDISSKNPATFLKTLKQVREIIDKEQITVIHTHHRMAAWYTALLSKKRDLVFINTSHNTFYNNKGMTRMAYKNAHLIACGEMVKKNLVEEFRLPECQVQVIHNAVKPFSGLLVEVEELRHLREQGYTLVGNVGRLAEQKGMEYFIASLPKVLTHCPKVKYVIVGSGVDEEKLHRQVQELGLTDSVVFLGYRSDIQNVMAQMDFIVLSSLWEGLPLTPMEAFSVRKAVIGTAVDGTVEIIKDGYNGFLIPPKDPDTIAEKVIALADDEGLRRALEEHSWETFCSKFSFERFGSSVLNYYESL